MSVSGPAARMTDELVAVAVSALQAASSELYRQLAWNACSDDGFTSRQSSCKNVCNLRLQ
jgi:hypothetical protein